MSDDSKGYQAGFGNTFETEAVAGALPRDRATPRHAAFGLYAEQINGTGFTVRRSHNRRTWMYRLRPQIVDQPFEPMPHRSFTGRFGDARSSPEVMRFRPIALPTSEPTDFLDGITTFAGAGDPCLRRGMAVHLFAANRNMQRAFCNIDGDLLIVPEHGRLAVLTELGWLRLAPGELGIVPRGLRFRVDLIDGVARGFMAELFDGHFELPDRGLVGANGLADERHFLAPRAYYEDANEACEIVVKQGGDLYRQQSPHGPFDVVAWFGSYAPFKYDLASFGSMGNVRFDHPDPSILTVLTCPADALGHNAIDVAVFQHRWDVTQDTFRPPYFHRNSAVELNAVIRSPAERGPWVAGAFSYTPLLSPHGISAAGVTRELDKPEAVANQPEEIGRDSIWVQFESTYSLRVLPSMFDQPARDTRYLSGFRDYPRGELARATKDR